MNNVIIALLRGINVGGRNKLRMQDLRDLLTEMGLRDVKTYIQSGNVVFRGDAADKQQLAQKISAAIGSAHGFTPNVHLITADDLQTAIANNPFSEAINEPKTLHLYFLDGIPESPDLSVLTAVQTEVEQFQLINNVFYFHAPRMHRSKLAQKIERVLGVSATARNWRTANKLAEMVATYE